MEENKGKDVMDEATRSRTQSQPYLAVGDKRKNLSKAIDLENLPSRCKEKRAKYRSSKTDVVKPGLPTPTSQQPSIQIHDVDSSELARVPPSMTTVPTSSQPPRRAPMNLIENEDLAWERFEKVVTDEDVAACYDMSLKEFEQSAVHDLFKVRNILFTLSCHSNVYVFIIFNITSNYLCRPCPSSSLRPGRPRRWTR